MTFPSVYDRFVLRPVSRIMLNPSPFAVVPILYNPHHAPACFLRIHRLLPLSTAQRQASPPHLLLHRHGSVLLHL